MFRDRIYSPPLVSDFNQGINEFKHHTKIKMAHRLHRLTLRGWHPQPIIAAGIRKRRRKNFGIKTRFIKIVIQIIKRKKISVNSCNSWAKKKLQ